MDVESGQPILSSQENGNEMYKLTYDSEDNDEINAPTASPERQRFDGNDSKMKSDPQEATETGNGELLSPNHKKTKDTATYEGNGRYYSLFANDNFMTEDPKNKRKACICFGLKTALFIATIVILAGAILGLMWIVRGLQIEHKDMERRLTVLEKDDSTGESSSSSSSSAADSESHFSSMLQKPQPNEAAAPMSAGFGNTHFDTTRLDYFEDVLKGNAKRFEGLEEKLKQHVSNDNIRAAEVYRVITENTIDVDKALSMVQTVKKLLQKVDATADTAKNLALLALKDADSTEVDLNKYLETTQSDKAKEKVAFSVAHAMGNDHIIHHDPQRERSSITPPLPYYDVNFDFAPIISFTEEIVDTGDYISPGSGTFQAPFAGNYVIFVSFCVPSNADTSIHLMRNNKLLREMKISADSSSTGQQNAEPFPIPPLGFPIHANPSINDKRPPSIPVPPENFADSLSSHDGSPVNLSPPGFPAVQVDHPNYDSMPPLPDFPSEFFPDSSPPEQQPPEFNPQAGFPAVQVDDHSLSSQLPLPTPVLLSDSVSRIRPYHFTEVTSLEEGDTLHLRIAKGSIAEYVYLPGTNAIQESCTRLAGYNL